MFPGSLLPRRCWNAEANAFRLQLLNNGCCYQQPGSHLQISLPTACIWNSTFISTCNVQIQGECRRDDGHPRTYQHPPLTVRLRQERLIRYEDASRQWRGRCYTCTKAVPSVRLFSCLARSTETLFVVHIAFSLR